MIWKFNQRPGTTEASAKIETDLSTQSFDLLRSIDAESIVLTSNDQVIYYSDGIATFNLILFSLLTSCANTSWDHRSGNNIDLDFHSALFRAAHHERLNRSWEILRSQIHTFLVYTWSQDDSINKKFLPHWSPDHTKLLDIIKEKKIDEAHEVIDQHVARGLERVVTHFAEQPVKAKKSK